MDKRRSKGVTFLGVASLFLGTLLLAGYFGGGYSSFDLDVFSLIQLIATFGFIVAGFFILQLKNWARVVFLVLMGLNAVAGLHGVYFGSPLTVVPGKGDIFLKVYLPIFFVASFLPFVIAFYFFTRSKVKGQFIARAK